MNELEELLDPYQALDAEESACLAHIKAFVKTTPWPAAISRYNRAGHITASAFVINRSRTHAMLLQHASLGKWLQPGGHVEPSDASVLAAALREVEEETGIRAAPIQLGIFDVDVHPIPNNFKKNEPAHLHLDLRFLVAADQQQVAINDESLSARWVSLTDGGMFATSSLNRMRRKCLALKSRDEERERSAFTTTRQSLA